MKKQTLSRAEVANIIESFLVGTIGKYDWDDFISFPLDDPALERIRARCDGLSYEFPSETPGHYTNEAGKDVLRGYVDELRGVKRHGEAA